MSHIAVYNIHSLKTFMCTVVTRSPGSCPRYTKELNPQDQNGEVRAYWVDKHSYLSREEADHGPLVEQECQWLQETPTASFKACLLQTEDAIRLWLAFLTDSSGYITFWLLCMCLPMMHCYNCVYLCNKFFKSEDYRFVSFKLLWFRYIQSLHNTRNLYA